MNREVYKHILATYGKRPGIWLAFMVEVIRAFIGRVVTVILLANVVSAITKGDLKSAQNDILLWGALTIVVTVLAAATELKSVLVENEVYAQLCSDYYRKLTNKDMAFYRDNHAGYLTATFRQYLDSAIIMVRLVRGEMIRMFISLIFPAIVLVTASWKIGLVAILMVIVEGIYMVWSSKKTNEYRNVAHEIYKRISGEVADDITNIVAYKSAGKEKEALKRINSLREEETNAFWQRRKVGILLDLPRNILTTILVTVAFWLALKTSNKLDETLGILVMTITYMFQIMRNISDLPDLIYRHDDLVSKMAPTLEILNNDYEAIHDQPSPITFHPKKGEIVIRNLKFSYEGETSKIKVFDDFNLHIKSGEKIGVVGLSGAGKSTLANLLMRFDDIQEGQILIDGMDIKKIPQSQLRENIAYVPQEPLLFHRTVRENIAYQNNKATDEEVRLAAKAAHAAEFIDELPEGYHTIVGERGVKLSGGQKQRVVIARAVLKKAPILLFDEATSALDSESEQIIKKALPGIIGNHTAIVIAHRLSTVAGLDRIIVMHKGKIIEEGTHHQLLTKKGRYYSLWQRQISDSAD